MASSGFADTAIWFAPKVKVWDDSEDANSRCRAWPGDQETDFTHNTLSTQTREEYRDVDSEVPADLAVQLGRMYTHKDC